MHVCGEMHIYNGSSAGFFFCLKLPKIGRETFHGVDRNLEWFIIGRMNIKERVRPIMCGSEIIVTKPSEVTKETVREVVLIPCAYCGGFMPQTSTLCPNCGARRKT